MVSADPKAKNLDSMVRMLGNERTMTSLGNTVIHAAVARAVLAKVLGRPDPDAPHTDHWHGPIHYDSWGFDFAEDPRVNIIVEIDKSLVVNAIGESMYTTLTKNGIIRDATPEAGKSSITIKSKTGLQ